MKSIPEPVTEWLEKEIARHGQWRQIWSVSYFTIAASTVVTGALTTASAGLSEDPANTVAQTTLLAAITTILASLEKVLRLREKWDLHRNIQIDLELIELKVASGLINLKEAVRDIEGVAGRYSESLADLTRPVHDDARHPEDEEDLDDEARDV